jgi:hypothetical protein
MTETEKALATWCGDAPSKCDLCGVTIRAAFVDGTTYQGASRGMVGGRWACMCLKCHNRHGVGLGLGVGQQYEKQHVPVNGGGVKLAWVKVRG